jgi:hypothetical protein
MSVNPIQLPLFAQKPEKIAPMSVILYPVVRNLFFKISILVLGGPDTGTVKQKIKIVALMQQFFFFGKSFLFFTALPLF